jgi:hypothetical protein
MIKKTHIPSKDPKSAFSQDFIFTPPLAKPLNWPRLEILLFNLLLGAQLPPKNNDKIRTRFEIYVVRLTET